MKFLFNIKNQVEDLYLNSSFFMGYITRLVISFLALMVLRGNIGFNLILSNILFVVAYAMNCASLPSKLLMLALAAYFVVQVFSLTIGDGDNDQYSGDYCLSDLLLA